MYIAGELDYMTFKGLFQLKQFYEMKPMRFIEIYIYITKSEQESKMAQKLTHFRTRRGWYPLRIITRIQQSLIQRMLHKPTKARKPVLWPVKDAVKEKRRDTE